MAKAESKAVKKNSQRDYVIMAVEDLLENPKNARTHSKKQINKLAKSIESFGFMRAVEVDENNVILSGHGRLMAAKKLKLTHVQCLVVDDLTEQEKLAYMLADNRIALESEFDESVLKINLEELRADDFDLAVTGFDESEIGEYFDLQESASDADDDVPTIEKINRSKVGDVWVLGDHRLMCGDSTEISDVNNLLNGKKADLVFTDPPYRMEAEGGSNQPIGRAAAKLGEAIKHLCEFDPVKFLENLPKVFEKNMNAYVFCNKDLVPDYLNWCRENGYSFNILFWKKPNAIPLGKQHRPDVEYLIFIRKSAIWNDGLQGVSYSKCLEHGRESGLHPTMKPVSMIMNQINISSKYNSLVFDFFGGSGSTLIACEKTNRICYMMELDPHYVDVIISRWEKFTGKEAVRESDGVTFSQLTETAKGDGN